MASRLERRPQDAAVKLLHQQSASNSKPDYIMGHSFQAVSLLVQGPAAMSPPCAGLAHSRGLIWSNRDTRTLLDKLALLLFSLAGIVDRKLLLVADATTLGKMIRSYSPGHQLVNRASRTQWPTGLCRCPRAVADGQGSTAKSEAQDLARDQSQFISAPSPSTASRMLPALSRHRSAVAAGRTAGALVIVCHPMPARSSCWPPI